ncbi:hypothetical protein GNZ12_06675 [Paraburkholderia sp. 1N]|uniref:Uncharacterized protein n=1 Tax=Paraburkholderia solitsugae TaxID=2675748 RepID=A0ABX2BNC6_9BURK|nr:hypothetical protein [Paraburkholderia solitsugae]NPT41007.1 hypothetical protein [Paraburkholderia solitsugae]
MEQSNYACSQSSRRFALTYIANRCADLLNVCLTDAATDIEVASSELLIFDASFVRLRRALDRVACAQRLLETMREVGATGCSRERLRADGGNVGAERVATGWTDVAGEMRAVVELLARESPDEYPAGAVEWMVVENGSVSHGVTTATNGGPSPE